MEHHSDCTRNATAKEETVEKTSPTETEKPKSKKSKAKKQKASPAKVENTEADTSTAEVSSEEKKTGLFIQLGLNEEQTKKANALNKVEKLAIKKAKKKFRKARRNYNKAFDNLVDNVSLETAFNDLQAAKLEVAISRFQQMMKFREILTPEQLKAFHELKAKRRKK